MKKLSIALCVCALLAPMVGCGANTEVSEPEAFSAPPISQEELSGSKRAANKKAKEKVGDAAEPVE